MAGPITDETGMIVRPEEQEQTVMAMLQNDKVKVALEQALPRQLDLDYFTRTVQTAIRRNPKILQCTPASFLSALLQAAQAGLEVDTVLGHAYLIPYGKECVLVVGYKGYINLALRSGKVTSIEAHVVRKGDEFEYEYGLDQQLSHKPKADLGADRTHAWALARLAEGVPQFDVMPVTDIDAIRARSRSGHSGPWTTDPEEMERKTVVRRLCKYLPMSPEAQRIVTIDEMADAGLRQEFDVDLPELEGEVTETAPPEAQEPHEDQRAAPLPSEQAPPPAKPKKEPNEGDLFRKWVQDQGKKPADVVAALGHTVRKVLSEGTDYSEIKTYLGEKWSRPAEPEAVEPEQVLPGPEAVPDPETEQAMSAIQKDDAFGVVLQAEVEDGPFGPMDDEEDALTLAMVKEWAYRPDTGFEWYALRNRLVCGPSSEDPIGEFMARSRNEGQPPYVLAKWLSDKLGNPMPTAWEKYAKA